MNTDRKRKVAERLAQIPKLYRALYDRAITGRSRKAAMHSFCVECCGHEIREVYLCTDLACQLYAYRPQSRVSPVASKSVPEPPESKNCEQRRLWWLRNIRNLVKLACGSLRES